MQPHNEPVGAPSITGTRDAVEAPHGAVEGREEATGGSADDAAIQILSEQGAQCGDCGDQPGDRVCPDCERCRRWYVAALRAAGWAPRSEVLGKAAQTAQALGYIEHAPEHGWSDQHDAWDGGRDAVVDLLGQAADRKTP